MKKIKHTFARKTGRWAIGALLAALLVSAESCSTLSKKGPAPPVEAKGPIVAMMMASSLDDKGRPVNSRFTFPQNEPQITAIVQVGKISGATLSVTWYITSDSGDEKLFEHQIPVKSHDRAFSIGRNLGGMLLAGTYKVVATLEGQTTDMEFDVAPLSTPGNKTSTGRNEKIFENQLRFTNDDRAYSVASNPDGLLAASRYGLFAIESWLLKASLDAAWQTASPTPTGSPGAEGQPPVQGTSGTVPQSEIPRGRHVGTSASGCYVLPEGDYPDWATEVADVIDVSCRGDCSAPPPGLHPIIVSATVTGPSKQIGSYVGMEGGVFADYYVDPCYLSGGSDLPGTKVMVTSSVKDSFDQTKEIGSVNATFTLADDTLAPRAKVTSTPNKGAKVKAGDKINIKVTAQERRKNGPWQTGVKVIQITADPGGLVKDPWVNPSKLPKPCAEKTWEQQDQATYTVPSNPPPIIKICVIAEDYAGNQGTNCGEFYTGKVWTGTIHATGTGTGPGGTGGSFTGTYDGKLTLVEGADGAITGHAQVAASGCSAVKPAKSILFDVTGTDNGKQLELQIVPSSFRIDGTNCGFGYGWVADPYGSPHSAIIPITAPGMAQGAWEGHFDHPSTTATVRYQFSLTADSR